MIDAFHSNWTAPFFALKKSEKYYIEDFEILTTMLSALEWQKNNGNIKMVTDEIGADFYRKIGIDSIWNLGIDDTLGKAMNKDINPTIFWAAGKIAALKKQQSPCIMMDTDFIVWKSLYNKLNCSLAAIHREELSDVYPGKSAFKTKDNFNLDAKFDWTVKPFNTAFVYINDDEFLKFYTENSMKFMKNLIDSDDNLINMVFAEQRMFSMCAEKLNLEVKELMPLSELSKNRQDYFTHVWGLKDVMRRDKVKRKEFCKRCVNRLITDFPEYERNIAQVDVLKLYYKDVKFDRKVAGSVK
ncbi:MAG: hypothetical protein E7213_08035 [Clostridium sp.]|jgi:hypothetical protein|nr:hypothetical protein [Clostridium sp.]